MASAAGAQKPAWITDAVNVQMKKYPLLKGWLWFNENKEQDWEKVEEEIGELQEAVTLNFDFEKQEEEFGDVLFSLVNYARFIGVDPETALERVNKKFKKRFEYIEANADKDLNDMTLAEMDALWNEAKNENLKI